MSVHDLRYVKTEELIRKAFLACCSEHTIEEIHTKDICAKARISRNAFYGHYENKYQLLEAVYGDVQKEMLNDLTPEIISSLSKNGMNGVCEWCIRSVAKNRELLKILATSSEHHFRNMIRTVFIDTTLDKVFANTELIDEDPALILSRNYIADGLTSTVLTWFNKADDVDEEYLIEHLYEISHQAAEYFYKQLDDKPGITRR